MKILISLRKGNSILHSGKGPYEIMEINEGDSRSPKISHHHDEMSVLEEIQRICEVEGFFNVEE